MSSCTGSLETAYAYLDLPRGARVAVPTWTFVSTALAAAKHAALPVLLDVDTDTLNLREDALNAALADGIDAVVAVHFGGVQVSKEIHQVCASAACR
jgi:dTDP-4-amino-4,6-dideoxygalactose transaminase